mgnify:CR=1 FL=1
MIKNVTTRKKIQHKKILKETHSNTKNVKCHKISNSSQGKHVRNVMTNLIKLFFYWRGKFYGAKFMDALKGYFKLKTL